jgi:DNA-binding HxlR family transcriptional regulator
MVERSRNGTKSRARIDDMTSGLDAAMAAVGDRWTLLVVDALLDGPRRFSELQEAIPKVAPNVLTARLRRLEEQGLIAGARYSDRPPRVEYRVTEAGRELAGALRLLSRWGARDGGAEVEGPHHRSCGTPLEARWYCPTCARVTEQPDDDLRWV